MLERYAVVCFRDVQFDGDNSNSWPVRITEYSGVDAITTTYSNLAEVPDAYVVSSILRSPKILHTKNL